MYCGVLCEGKKQYYIMDCIKASLFISRCGGYVLDDRQFKTIDSARVSLSKRLPNYMYVDVIPDDVNEVVLAAEQFLTTVGEGVASCVEDAYDDITLATKIISKISKLGVHLLETLFSDDDFAIISVDGAYKPETKKAGYGYVSVYSGVTYEEGGVAPDADTSLKAEMTAVRFALGHALAQGAKEVFLLYDCSGVYTSTIKRATKSDYAASYYDFIKIISEHITIRWVKVKGHSGVPIHTQADVLAALQVGRMV